MTILIDNSGSMRENQSQQQQFVQIYFQGLWKDVWLKLKFWVLPQNIEKVVLLEING